VKYIDLATQVLGEGAGSTKKEAKRGAATDAINSHALLREIIIESLQPTHK
jgi:dsRNA-specific ribonuclease